MGNLQKKIKFRKPPDIFCDLSQKILWNFPQNNEAGVYFAKKHLMFVKVGKRSRIYGIERIFIFSIEKK